MCFFSSLKYLYFGSNNYQNNLIKLPLSSFNGNFISKFKNDFQDKLINTQKPDNQAIINKTTMTFSKLIFYLLYIFNSLTMLFYVATIFFNLTTYKAFNRNTENIVFALATLVLAIGIYIAHNKAYNHQNFTFANITFVVSWISALLVILIGLLFFNGPIHWQ